MPVQFGLALAILKTHQEKSMPQGATATLAWLQNEHCGPPCSLQPSQPGALPSGRVYPTSVKPATCRLGRERMEKMHVVLKHMDTVIKGGNAWRQG